MPPNRRFRKQSPKVKALLAAAQAAECNTPDEKVRKALTVALDAFALPATEQRSSNLRAFPLRSPRRAPVRAEAEFEAWQAIGEQYVEELYALDLAIEECHEMLKGMWNGIPRRVGVEWIPYPERRTGWERGALRPVVFRADRTARAIGAAAGHKRFVVSEIPLEGVRMTLAQARPGTAPEFVRAQREVLAALRAVLQARDELYGRIAGEITHAGNWGRPLRGGLAASQAARAAVDRLKPLAQLVTRLMRADSPSRGKRSSAKRPDA